MYAPSQTHTQDRGHLRPHYSEGVGRLPQDPVKVSWPLMAHAQLHDLHLRGVVAVALMVAREVLVMLRIRATTFWISQIRQGRLVLAAIVSESRSTRRHFNAISVRKDLPERTTCDHIFERTQTKDPLSAQSVARHSLVSTIGNGTKACIQERRSLYARAHCRPDRSGGVGGALLELMLLADTSDPRQAVCVSNHC